MWTLQRATDHRNITNTTTRGGALIKRSGKVAYEQNSFSFSDWYFKSSHVFIHLENKRIFLFGFYFILFVWLLPSTCLPFTSVPWTRTKKKNDFCCAICDSIDLNEHIFGHFFGDFCFWLLNSCYLWSKSEKKRLWILIGKTENRIKFRDYWETVNTEFFPRLLLAIVNQNWLIVKMCFCDDRKEC